MAEGEPSTKKRKLNSEQANIFKAIHVNRDLINDLKHALSNLVDSPYSGYGVYLSKIETCNASSSRPFSKASCETINLKNEKQDETKGYAIMNVFQYGAQVLGSFFEAPHRVPLREGARLALLKLSSFLLADTKKALINLPKGLTETEWTVRLAHHLLSKLSVSPTYLMDHYYQGKRVDLRCVCGCNERLTGTYGDTSVGVQDGWHGPVDILMDVAIKIPSIGSGDGDSPGTGNQSSAEVMVSEDVLDSSRQQMRAQTIVFSFLQLKNHPELKNHLIPTLAFSRKKLVICMYDCVNDMLLETPELKLLDSEKFNQQTILVLWLALNYRYFCSGLTEKMLETRFTADFYKQIGNRIDQYKQFVCSPCDYVCTDGNVQVDLFRVEICRENKKDINNINDDPDIL